VDASHQHYKRKDLHYNRKAIWEHCHQQCLQSHDRKLFHSQSLSWPSKSSAIAMPEPPRSKSKTSRESTSSPRHRLLSCRMATAKAWFVIFILSSTFGLSFWPVPTTAALQSKLAIKFGEPLSSAWFVPAYTTANAIGFLIAGANSDLFGRRLFLLFGNACCCVGFIVTATAGGASQFTAGLAITGFGGGFCQMAMCSIPGTLLEGLIDGSFC
jgi:hypothetical protein